MLDGTVDDWWMRVGSGTSYPAPMAPWLTLQGPLVDSALLVRTGSKLLASLGQIAA
jgi:hypothetical protein